MNFNSPKSEPKKSKEKIDTMKVEKTEIASKPTQKPIDKPRNKIESPKIDIKKEPRNKIQREKVNLLTPTRNKIERPKIDFKRESRNKIQREKINLLTPSRNKIERPKFDPTAPTRNKIEPRKIDPKKEPKHKIQPRVIDPKAPPRHKIERPTLDLTREPKNKITLPKLESKDMQNFDTNPLDKYFQNVKNDILKLEKIKEEIKNVDWKSISDNWSITTHPNQYAKSLDPTKNPSLENPLYRKKEWLNKVYHNKNWNLTDKKIANLCGVSQPLIIRWRKRHQIPRKEGNWVNISNGNAQGKLLNVKTGRVCISIPEEYVHPELKPKENPIVLYFNNNKKFTKNEIEFLQKNDINIEDLKSRYGWVENEKIATQFYREVIHSQFKRIPTTEELHKSGFSGYMSAVRKKLRIGMTELVKKTGLAPRYEVRFKYDDKNFSDLQEFFTGKVYPELKIRHGLEGSQPPTSTHISSSEYRGLLSALKKFGYSYNEFIKNLGFKPKYEYTYKNKSYSELKTIFKEQIVPSLNEKLKLKSKSPSYDEVETYYRGFINTIDRFNKSYTDFVKDLGLNPRQTFEAELGVANHEALKFVISESLNHDKNRFNYYSEIKILHPKRNLQIDGLIINNTSFSKDIKKKMENFNIRETQASNLIKEIPKKDFILFDFSNGYFCRNNIIKTELIARKIQKYHNLDNSLLFLVGTRWPSQKTIRVLPRVINNDNTNISTQNTFLINPSLFSRLVGLEGESLKNFNNIISFNEKRDLESIKEIIDEYKERKIIILNTDHFKNTLKNRSLHRWI